MPDTQKIMDAALWLHSAGGMLSLYAQTGSAYCLDEARADLEKAIALMAEVIKDDARTDHR